MFAELRISPQLLAKAHVCRVTDTEARRDYGIVFAPASDLSGIVFPYYHPAVEWRVTARLRRDHPEIGEDGERANKYICPRGDARHLYFPPGAAEMLRDPETSIVLVESEKAALALMTWAKRRGIKLLALATGGCWSWRGRTGIEENARGERLEMSGPLADLSYCNNRKVYILFDANVATNDKVKKARTELIVELSKAERNCTVMVVDLPLGDGINGPDDLICMQGDDAIGELFTRAYSPADKSVGGGLAWPEPEDLGHDLPLVPEFDPELLPISLRPWCIDMAERMQVPLDFPAVAAVASLGASVMRRAMIQPKALDSSWTEYGNLWGAIIGSPGMMKSPIITAVTAPLHGVEFLWHAEYQSQVAQAASNKREAELRRKAWEQQYVATLKKGGTGGDPPIHPDDSVSEPRQKRLITSDATFEKLHEIMADNPAGIACWRDELTGWLAGLERQERKSERQFFLEGWSGHSGYIVDRIGRGSIHVPHCCLSVFGGIQPNRIRSYLTDVLRGGPTDDGLIQRFGLLVWPDFNGSWRYVDRLPNAIAQNGAVVVYQQLVKLDAENPLRLKFDRAAQELFIEWLTAHQKKVLCDDTPPVMCGHLAKYRKLMPALSLLFALADKYTDTVPLDSAKRAAAWCEYLEPHAYRVYASKLFPEMEAAQLLARKLKGGWMAAEPSFSVRDVYRPQWTGITSPEEGPRRAGCALRVRLGPQKADRFGRSGQT
jgi:hypothetical protein